MKQRILSLARGIVRVEVECKYPERFINLCAANGLEFWGVSVDENGTVGLFLRERGYKRLAELSSKHGFTVRHVSKTGAPSMWRRVRKRYILIAGVILALILTRMLSLFVWDISVYGNESVPVAEILRTLNRHGFKYGTFTPSVRSEELADKMLLDIPELSWFAVNLSGSRAEVMVRERIPTPKIINVKTPAVVIAAKSGVITKIIVLEGTPLVKVGDTVEKGARLISGILDSRSNGVRAVHALAEIEARTWYDFSAQMPLETIVKDYTGEEKQKHSLIVLQNRINFALNSGISWANYDKITSEKPLTLPGGIILPIKLVTETYTQYTPIVSARQRTDAELVLKASLEARLMSAIGDGSVTAASWESAEKDGVLTVTLHAECLEQIAVSVEVK